MVLVVVILAIFCVVSLLPCHSLCHHQFMNSGGGCRLQWITVGELGLVGDGDNTCIESIQLW